jgi:hypothetical protein
MQAITKLLLAWTVCTAPALAAPLSFSFTSSLFNAQLGQTVVFSATLANTGPTSLFLNSDTVTVSAPLIVDDTYFFLFFPLSLSAGQSVTAPILNVTVPASAAFGLYVGSISIQGGATPSDLTTQASQSFAVNVVPEPGSLMLLLLGAAAIAAIRKKTRTGPVRRSHC